MATAHRKHAAHNFRRRGGNSGSALGRPGIDRAGNRQHLSHQTFGQRPRAAFHRGCVVAGGNFVWTRSGVARQQHGSFHPDQRFCACRFAFWPRKLAGDFSNRRVAGPTDWRGTISADATKVGGPGSRLRRRPRRARSNRSAEGRIRSGTDACSVPRIDRTARSAPGS